MTKEEIQEIIAKYRRKSDQEQKYGADKCAMFDRIADQLEQDVELYVDDDFYQSEKEIIDDIVELFDDHDKYFGEEEELDARDFIIDRSCESENDCY